MLAKVAEDKVLVLKALFRQPVTLLREDFEEHWSGRLIRNFSMIRGAPARSGQGRATPGLARVARVGVLRCGSSSVRHLMMSARGETVPGVMPKRSPR
ncbi:MAG: hypothetical protein H7840_08690 [Alphaproteobacteria bacterium]